MSSRLRLDPGFIPFCRDLLNAKADGRLGDCVMPEDTNPGFSAVEQERRLSYFTLPMALNYQRDSYKLWQAACQTYQDLGTADVFDIAKAVTMPIEDLRSKLQKHRLALQPNKHIATWRTISGTVADNWRTLSGLFEATDHDFLRLRELIQHHHKRGFPYLSGPKIFNYWSFIIQGYGGVQLKHADQIEIAPDTHIIQASVRLGLLTAEEAEQLPRDEISRRWREALAGSGIDPITMHPALWFWSRSRFAYQPSD